MIKKNTTLNLRKVLFLSASFLTLFVACKEEGFLNPPFAENTTSADFTDTIRIVTETEKGDTILADKISTGLAGVFRDSVFGLSTAAFNVQPLLPSNFLVFGEEDDVFICDSVILSLEYEGSYGDITKSQTLEVYRIDEQLEFSTSYYSNSIVAVQPAVLANHTFVPNLDSAVRVVKPNGFFGLDTISLSPQLRIPLDKALGTEILNSPAIDVATNSQFTAFFNGLRVSPINPGNLSFNEQAIIYYALTSTNSQMTIYYRSISTSNDTSRRAVDFPINSSSVRFNSFEHDYSGTPVETALQNSSYDAQHSYTLAMAGVQTLIKFPHLKNSFSDQKIVVNKAELVIPVANGSFSNFGFPENVIVATKDESGTLQFIPDFFEGITYFGGSFDAENQNYVFNISRYIQGVINGTENDNGLILLVSGSAVKADRAVIYGVDNLSGKITLNLYYSNTN